MSEESSNTTVQYIYEDEFSFVTDEGSLVLKKTPFFEERKIADLENPEESDHLESKIKDYKNAFDELTGEVEKIIKGEAPEKDALENLKEKILGADAIGDFTALLNQLEKALEEQNSSNSAATGNAVEKKSVDEDEETDSNEELVDERLKYYKEIVEKAEDLALQDDWPYVKMELDNLSHQWNEGPEVTDDHKNDLKELYKQLEEARERFEERKSTHYEKLKKQKQENLEKKQTLLTDLEKIVENKNWTAVKRVVKIKRRWRNIGLLPAGEQELLDKRFNNLVSTFEDHKVDRLVEKRQKEEDNLTGKLIVLDKMEEVAESINNKTTAWRKIDKEFDQLTNQFKKIGRVPSEKADEVWSRYKAAQDLYYDRKYEFDKKHRKKVDKFSRKKEKLCEEAEKLIEDPDLASATRKINRLHQKWKKVGNLPQRDEDKLWARFKSATDTFNERKSENSDLLHKQEEENYQKKLELIERASEVQDTDDWDEGHKLMQKLLDKWKSIGPVPRNKSRSSWKKFKKAQDVFYERRREHFKEVKENQKENLKEKEEILEKLRALGGHDDPIEAVEMAKPLQEEFKKAGYVPIKKKNKIWKEYREACDVIYERFRAAKSGNKFDQELAKADLAPKRRAKILDIRKEYKKVKRELNKLQEEMIQYKESKTYFKPSGKGSDLLDEIQKKIDKVESKVQEKQDHLNSLDREIEELRAEA